MMKPIATTQVQDHITGEVYTLTTIDEGHRVECYVTQFTTQRTESFLSVKDNPESKITMDDTIQLQCQAWAEKNGGW